jgi:hypothetical protein
MSTNKTVIIIPEPYNDFLGQKEVSSVGKTILTLEINFKNSHKSFASLEIHKGKTNETSTRPRVINP